MTPTTPTITGVGPDAVVLKDGSILRGTLVEVQQNVAVRLQMADGKIANVKWEVIERVDQAPRAPVVQQPPPSVVPPPPPSDTIMVHVDADAPVILEQGNTAWAGGEWHAVCEAPCDMPLPISAPYRITGPNTRKSKPFVLNPANGRVALDVQRATTGAFAAGIALVTAGPIVLLVGIVVTALGALESRSDASCLGTCSATNNGGSLVGTGLVLMGVGAASTVIGAILLGGNLRTKVGQFGVPAMAPAADLVRRPIWSSERAPIPGAPFTVPIVAASF